MTQEPGGRQDRSGGTIETQSRGTQEGHNRTPMPGASPWTGRKKSGRGWSKGSLFQWNTYSVKLNCANDSLQTVVAYNWKTGNVVKRFRGHEHDITKVNCPMVIIMEGIWSWIKEHLIALGGKSDRIFLKEHARALYLVLWSLTPWKAEPTIHLAIGTGIFDIIFLLLLSP